MSFTITTLVSGYINFRGINVPSVQMFVLSVSGIIFNSIG